MSKQKHTSFRYGEETAEYLSKLQESWGIENKSEVIRILIKAFTGLSFGNFLAILDKEKLVEEWGAVGKLLALMKEDPPSCVEKSQLAEVVKDVPYLVSAAQVELEEGGFSGED